MKISTFRKIILMSLLKIVAFISFLIYCLSNSLFAQPNKEFDNKTKRPNYADINYWAAHPWKKDLSDSLPKPLVNDIILDSLKVDVFFIHPTTYTNKNFYKWNYLKFHLELQELFFRKAFFIIQFFYARKFMYF